MAFPNTILLGGLTTVSLAESLAVGSPVGELDATVKNGETIDEFTVVSDFFEIVEATAGHWELRLKAGVDYETIAQQHHELQITVKSSDGTSATEIITVNVTPVSEGPPTDIALSATTVVENAIAGTVVGDLSALDPDLGETFSYSLMNADGAFKIENGKLVVADGSKLNFEASSSVQVTVKVTDSGNASYTETFTIAVTDGVDTVVGTKKNDWLVGTKGDDIINGGLGKDKLFGDTGKDIFVFDTPVKNGHFDQILDFKSGEDKIQIAMASLKSFKMKGLEKAVTNSHKMAKKFFKVGEKPADSNDFVYYNKQKGFVYLDSDGDGGKHGLAILKVKPGTTITADDFTFV
jgi:VCBS repeat-containing protein